MTYTEDRFRCITGIKVLFIVYVMNVYGHICMLIAHCRELSFKKGDAVNIIRQIDSNWYEGEHRGQIGIFPISYVEVNF